MKAYVDFASVYDRLTDNVDYEKMADCIVSILIDGGIFSGLLLDLACGTGALMRALLSKGKNYELIGIDGSAEMLSKAREKLCESGLDALLLCQDMRKTDLFGTVSAAFCTLDGINHLTSPADVLKAFRRLELFVEPGGLFIFDVNTPYKHKEVLADNSFVYDLDGVFCAWQNFTDVKTLTTDIFLDVFTRGKDGLYGRFSESFSERAYEDAFLTGGLDECGFDVIARYDGYSRKKPVEKTQRILYVSKRRK